METQEIIEQATPLITAGLWLTDKTEEKRLLSRVGTDNNWQPGRAALALFFIGSKEEEERLFQAINQVLALQEVAS